MTLIKTSILSVKSPTRSKSLNGDLSNRVEILVPSLKSCKPDVVAASFLLV